MKLDVNAAERTIEERIAQPLGYTGRDGMIRMADGMISIATVIMARAIRRISVEMGSTRATSCSSVMAAADRSMPVRSRMSCRFQRGHPPEPGNFSAIGMLSRCQDRHVQKPSSSLLQ